MNTVDAIASLDIDYIDCQPPPSGCGAYAAPRRQGADDQICSGRSP